jgi:endonuclease/exonuclease/phosphatase family metal-dependent hydrolase
MAESAKSKTSEQRQQRGISLPRALFLLLILIAVGFLVSGILRVPAGPATGTSLLNAAAVHPTTRPIIRVATYNIHSGVGADGRADFSRTADALRGFDLIALNEVRGENQIELLGEKLAMPSLFAPTERQWWHDSFGNALLCSLPTTHWQRIPLPGSVGRGCRNVLLVKITIEEKPINVLLTHIDRGTDRQEQLRTVIELFLSLTEPAIVMGDFNTETTDAQLLRLSSMPGVEDAVGKILGPKTPKNRIDWIFTRGLRCRDAGLNDNGASDHPLAWAELELTR